MNKKKMKNKIVSLGIPAFIEDIQPSTSAHTTTAKLRVFHCGTTSDGRRFTKDFSQKIAATIRETPVVARYEDDDFIGHAWEQSVFGYVPETATVAFEFIDGVEWLVTEVKLFTEREDIGAIARKIVGQAQSLELDPMTIDLSFEETEDGNTEIVFHDGNLVGLSVLGLNQEPAFTGSGFFAENKDISLADLIGRYNTSVHQSILMTIGGNLMEKNKTPIDPVAIEPTEPAVDPVEPIEPIPAEPQPVEAVTPVEPEGEEGVNGTTEQTVEAEGQESETDTATLDEAEREELNAYRRASKEALLEEYEEYLEEAEVQKFTDTLDDYTAAELKKELAVIAMQKVLEEKKEKDNKPATGQTFSISSTKKEYKTELGQLVADYK